MSERKVYRLYQLQVAFTVNEEGSAAYELGDLDSAVVDSLRDSTQEIERQLIVNYDIDATLKTKAVRKV